MASSTETSLVSVLESKVLNFEKQLSELDLKYKTLLASVERNTDATKDGAGSGEDSKKPSGTSSDKAKVKDENEESSPYSRVKIIKILKDPETGERVERQDNSNNLKPEEAGDYGFILRKAVHDRFPDEEGSSEIDIVNPHLWDLLKEHLGDYPYHLFRASPVTLQSPYEAIVFGWDVLEKAANQDGKDEEDKRAREDLKVLLSILSSGLSGDAKLFKYFKIRDVCLREKTIQFNDLWTLFPPGTMVYGKPFQNEDQVFFVRDNVRPWPEHSDSPPKLSPWELECWTYDWKGEKFQRTGFTLVFEHFVGQRPITALPYYPFEEHPNRDSVRDALIKRGKIFRKLCTADKGSRLFEYDGDAIFGKKGFTGPDDGDVRSAHLLEYQLRLYRRLHSAGESVKPDTGKSSYVKSRVMVDYLSYFKYGPPVARNGPLEPSRDDMDCMCSDCQRNRGLMIKYRTRFDTEEMQERKDWEDDQYILCPPRLLGYILREKQWAQLQVTLVTEIPEIDPGDAWNNRLQLADDEETKKLLYSLVRTHILTSKKVEPGEPNLEVDDIVPGKGKGLVILLYGPPGVGKTSTAETIAVATRKPLFSIGVADVGTKARHVESNLSKIFALATSWQAILLIDEADVFLESRGRGAAATTDRNGLVSVFLRVLEYYQGIMFLTTNQIAQFDVAIPSRIHVSIKYESLKPAQMEKIFQGFLQPLDEKGLVDDYKDIATWLSEDVYTIGFDGRQIRNIVTTALGLARAEMKYKKGKPTLTKKHLRSVVNNARSFKSDFLVQYDRYINSQDKLIQ
ncbi:P-loop containing nucleoside triphosphate hydrolase protein [Hypomontagnella submonticulosa]|nr:P-loop containing nucleoside triphosphate hydrolase protein [Hypomontagnella submonticulosa]